MRKIGESLPILVLSESVPNLFCQSSFEVLLGKFFFLDLFFFPEMNRILTISFLPFCKHFIFHFKDFEKTQYLHSNDDDDDDDDGV